MESNKKESCIQQNSIELRSEKMRNVIGQLPTYLIRVSCIVYLLVVINLVGIALFLFRLGIIKL